MVPEFLTDFFFHFGPFLPFYPPMDPENQSFGKMKKNPGDIILLNMCTKNGVWFLRYGAQHTEFFCHFGLFFTLSPHYGPKKSKF